MIRYTSAVVTLALTRDNKVFSELGGSAAVFDGHFKLVKEVEIREPLQLYDLEKDPRELHNLVKEESHETTRRELLDKLENHLSNNLDEKRFQMFREKGARRF